jgi:tetratricopeptide (TPR) repeat protein
MRTLNGWTVVALLCAATAAPMGFAADAKAPEGVDSPEFKELIAKGTEALNNGVQAMSARKNEERLRYMKEAAECFEKANKMAPKDLQTLDSLACSYLYSEQFEKAIATFNSYIDRVDDNQFKADCLCLRGIAWQGLNKLEESLKDVNEALKLAPQLQRGLLMKANLEQRMKK